MRIDHGVVKILDQIVESDSSDYVFNECRKIVQKKNLVTPVLNRIRKDPKNKFRLSVRYFATALLRSIRRATAYETIDRCVAKGTSPYTSVSTTYEETLYNLSHFDPGFEDAAPYRERTLETIRKEAQKDPKFKKAPIGEKVAIIYRSVTSVLHGLDSPLARGDTSEDNSIVRLYAKEVLGHPITAIAIVERIARDFNIPVQIMEHKYIESGKIPAYILRVGVSSDFDYVWITGPVMHNHTFRDITYNCVKAGSLLQTFRQLEHATESSVGRILKPMELANQIGMYTQNFQLFESKLKQDEENKPLSKLYPITSSEYSEMYHQALYDYYWFVQSSGKKFRKSVYFGVAQDGMFKKHTSQGFAAALSKQFPFDLPLIHNKKVFHDMPLGQYQRYVKKDYFNFQDSLDLRYNVPEDIKKSVSQRFKPGDTCYDEIYNDFKGDFGVILGYQYTFNPEKPDLVYRLATSGRHYISKNRVIVDGQCLPRVFDVICENIGIGLFMKSFDPKKMKFEPTPFLKKSGSTTLRRFNPFTTDAVDDMLARQGFDVDSEYLDHDTGFFGEGVEIYDSNAQYTSHANPEDDEESEGEGIGPEMIRQFMTSNVNESPGNVAEFLRMMAAFDGLGAGEGYDLDGERYEHNYFHSDYDDDDDDDDDEDEDEDEHYYDRNLGHEHDSEDDYEDEDEDEHFDPVDPHGVIPPGISPNIAREGLTPLFSMLQAMGADTDNVVEMLNRQGTRIAEFHNQQQEIRNRNGENTGASTQRVFTPSNPASLSDLQNRNAEPVVQPRASQPRSAPQPRTTQPRAPEPRAPEPRAPAQESEDEHDELWDVD